MPAAMIFDNVHGLNLRDVRVIWDTPVASQDRHAIYAGRVESSRSTVLAAGLPAQIWLPSACREYSMC